MALQVFKHNDRVAVALIPALLVFGRLVEPFILSLLLVCCHLAPHELYQQSCW